MVISKLKILIYLLLIALGIGIGYLIFANKTETIIIPAKEGEFKAQKPIYIRDTVTVYKTKWKTATDTIEVVTENPVNDSLALAYQQAKDSLDRFKMYLNSIQIRQFKNNFEDENITIDITGEVQGQLNWIKPKYKIKEQEIEVPAKKFGLSGFVGYGISKDGLSPQVGIGISYSLIRF